MIYFVTGGAGFIGTNFIYYMFKKYGNNIKIINIDSLTYAGNINNIKDLNVSLKKEQRYIFEKVDICDEVEVNRVFKTYQPDYVINFAAESHVDRSILEPQLFLKTNILGTQVLLDTAKKYGIKRFHQVSTDEVYGSLGEEGYFTETTPVAPRSPYSASKASADLLCQAYHETYNLPLTISRCSNNYGPYQFPEKLIPLMIHNILKNKSLPVYGDGRNVRDWLYVEDHCVAVDLIVHHAKDGEVYNVGGHNEWKNIDLIKLLIEKVKDLLSENDARLQHINKDLIQFVDDRKGHDRRYAIDPSKIKAELGWEPSIRFADGIVTTLKWYLENEQWVHDIISGKYRVGGSIIK
jgi:dTDP-glucose 4,6-dehydratase